MENSLSEEKAQHSLRMLAHGEKAGGARRQSAPETVDLSGIPPQTIFFSILALVILKQFVQTCQQIPFGPPIWLSWSGYRCHIFRAWKIWKRWIKLLWPQKHKGPSPDHFLCQKVTSAVKQAVPWYGSPMSPWWHGSICSERGLAWLRTVTGDTTHSIKNLQKYEQL